MKKLNALIVLTIMVGGMVLVNAGYAQDLLDDRVSGKEYLTNEIITFSNGIRLIIKARNQIDCLDLIQGIQNNESLTFQSILSAIDRNVSQNYPEEEILLNLDIDQISVGFNKNILDKAYPVKHIKIIKKFNHNSRLTWQSPVINCDGSILYVDHISGVSEIQEWTGSSWITFVRGTQGRMYDRYSVPGGTRKRGFRLRPLQAGSLVRANIVVIYYRAGLASNDESTHFSSEGESINRDNRDSDHRNSSGIRRIDKNVSTNRWISGYTLLGGWPCHAADIFVSVKAGTAVLYTCIGSDCSKGKWRRRAVLNRRNAPFLGVYRGDYKQRGFKIVGNGARVSYGAGYYTPYESVLDR